MGEVLSHWKPRCRKAVHCGRFHWHNVKRCSLRKGEALNQIISAKGKFSSFFTKDVAVKVYGNAAVARGIDIWKMAGSESKQRSSTWTDTWIRIEGKWRLVAAQDAESQPSK